MQFFTLTITPGEPYLSSVPRFSRLELTRAVIQPQPEGEATLYFINKAQHYPLCFLSTNGIQQHPIDLIFSEQSELKFAVQGTAHITIIGTLSDQHSALEMDQPEQGTDFLEQLLAQLNQQELDQLQ
ncbi:MAG: hypothetical protein EZS28_001197 [Streblomastix strix]|uniref:Nucleoplasmin-like domain-containing protein n=1 Tax=Streblomastix strix TaxID=222440 RepID=A0A5J4X9L4_9EUKA|nr:MAG: hypothetical protein EZS28_001197 [Streblomastix strix]